MIPASSIQIPIPLTAIQGSGSPLVRLYKDAGYVGGVAYLSREPLLSTISNFANQMSTNVYNIIQIFGRIGGGRHMLNPPPPTQSVVGIIGTVVGIIGTGRQYRFPGYESGVGEI